MSKISSMIAKVFKDAERAYGKEKVEAAKEKYISKLKELDRAKKVVSNIEREIEELKLEIIHDLES